MRRILGHLVPLALCGLAVGLATAAPTVDRRAVGRAESTICREGPPTGERCVDKGYLDGPCGTKYRNECKQIVIDGLAAHYEANASPLVPLIKPNKDNLPQDLNPKGKVVDYQGPNKKTLVGTFPKIRPFGKAVATTTSKSTLKSRTMIDIPRSDALTKSVGKLGSNRATYKLGTKTTKLGSLVQTSDDIFARTGLTRPPHSGLLTLPTNAHRNPNWDANGEKITSCEEYAYEKVYDWARYTDAVAACAGDHNCQLDIAFLPTTPGIAGRTLLRKDGKPVKTQISVKNSMKLPKNDFFAYGAKFVYSAGPDPLEPTPELRELATVLEKGADHYKIGCPKGTCRSGAEFKDEWDFHRKLHDRNRDVSMAEFEEYERRKAKFRELVSQHAAAVRAEMEAVTGMLPKGFATWVHPLDMVTANPLERLGIMRDRARETAQSMNQMTSKLTPAQKKALGGIGKATPSQKGTVQPKKATPGNKATPMPKSSPLERGPPCRRALRCRRSRSRARWTSTSTVRAVPTIRRSASWRCPRRARPRAPPPRTTAPSPWRNTTHRCATRKLPDRAGGVRPGADQLPDRPVHPLRVEAEGEGPP